jgi:hypothetical protein
MSAKDRISTLANSVIRFFSANNGKFRISDESKLALFQYPRTILNSELKNNNHVFIDKSFINKLTKSLLFESKYNKVRCIHPFLLLLSWEEINSNFDIIHCVSSDCVELREKDKKLNWVIQSRETLKIMELILNNFKFKKFFQVYYDYLILNGTSLEEVISYENKTRHSDLKLALTNKSHILVEINEKHHDKVKDLKRANEIFLHYGTMPIMYYQEEEDMTNLMPRIWKELSYSLAKSNKLEAIRFHLIMVDNLDAIFVNLITTFMNQDKIPIKNIVEVLEAKEMKKPLRYLKYLINESILEPDKTIFYEEEFEEGYVSNLGMDLIFMRVYTKYFEEPSMATEFCQEYSKIKTKYLNILSEILNQEERHLNILKEGYQELNTQINDITPVHPYITEIASNLYTKHQSEFPSSLNLHPSHFFLVRDEKSYIKKYTWKKVSKSNYHENEESSCIIPHYRFIKENEYQEIISYLDNPEDTEETEVSTEESNIKEKRKKKFTNSIGAPNNL